mmetsp:Transcript_16487/g.52949  ORF Transcript_16487/g.52949 Transcript_16487/m.52949 type:complete len:278 (-) Transcript_16487:8-841(-)
MKRRMQAAIGSSLAALSKRLRSKVGEESLGQRAIVVSSAGAAPSSLLADVPPGAGTEAAPAGCGACGTGITRSSSTSAASGRAAINAAAMQDPLFKDKHVRECYYFFTTGLCRLSEKCPYSHERVDGQFTDRAEGAGSAANAAALAPAAVVGAAMPGMGGFLGMQPMQTMQPMQPMGMLPGPFGAMGMQPMGFTGLTMPTMHGAPLMGMPGVVGHGAVVLPGMPLNGMAGMLASPLGMLPAGRAVAASRSVAGGMQVAGMFPAGLAGAPAGMLPWHT